MAQVHFTGNLPVNNHERRAVKYFEAHLPEHWDIYPNVEFSDGHSFPSECDQVIVGDHAVYVVEVKGWGGRIEGGKYQWHLTASGDFKDSPISQNSLKTKKLKSLLMAYDLSLRGVLTDSVIVLTDDKAKVTLQDEERWRVMHLQEAVAYMQDPTRLKGQAKSLASHRAVIGKLFQREFRPKSARLRIGGYELVGAPQAEHPRYMVALATNTQIRTQGTVLLKIYRVDIYAKTTEREIQQRLNERDANALFKMSPHPHIVR